MKTQIIHLNKNDDIISTREKLDWNQAGRILLIIPPDGKFLSNKLAIKLLKRHADKIGASLAVVTKDTDIRFFARQLGIPSIKNLRQAHEIAWGENRKIELAPQHPLRLIELQDLRRSIPSEHQSLNERPASRIISLTLGILALLSMAIVILPGAKITLSPRTETQSLVLTVQADRNASNINLSTGSLPSEVREVIVDGQASMTVSGKALIPDKVAQTVLLFSNITDHEINIQPETIVSTTTSDPVRFITPENQSISLAPGKSILVVAHAIIPGTGGNLPEDSITSIEGDLSQYATVTNIYTSHGGTDAFVPSPTAEDLTELTRNLSEGLKQQALEEFISNLGSGETLIQPSVRWVEIMNNSVTPEVGEPGRELTLSLQLRFEGQVVKDEMLNNMVVPILESSIKPGYQPVEGTLELEDISTPSFGEDGIMQWRIQAEQKIQVVITSDSVINSVKGSTINNAQDLLELTLPLAGDPQIKVFPAWWPRLPYMPMRIQISTGKS